MLVARRLVLLVEIWRALRVLRRLLQVRVAAAKAARDIDPVLLAACRAP